MSWAILSNSLRSQDWFLSGSESTASHIKSGIPGRLPVGTAAYLSKILLSWVGGIDTVAQTDTNWTKNSLPDLECLDVWFQPCHECVGLALSNWPRTGWWRADDELVWHVRGQAGPFVNGWKQTSCNVVSRSVFCHFRACSGRRLILEVMYGYLFAACKTF